MESPSAVAMHRFRISGPVAAPKIMEVQRCDADCDWPCRINCPWDRCTIVEELSQARVSIKMEDNGEVIANVLKRSIREVDAVPGNARASRSRRG